MNKAPSSDTTHGVSAAIEGMSWVVVGGVATRVLGLVGQIAVGWLLLPEEFGTYALALSFATAVGALRGGGAAQIMIKRGASFQQQSRSFFRYSLVFNFFAALILGLLAIPHLLKGSDVGVVVLGIAASLPIGTHAAVSRAQLTIERRFDYLTFVNFGAALSWQASVLVLAASGFGAASFAVAPILQALFESGALYSTSKTTLRRSRDANLRTDFMALFRESRWIMLSAAMLALATTGHYFAVGMLSTAQTVGIYYFAFQLVVSIGTPINAAIETVLPTLLTRLENDPARQSAAHWKAINWICVSTVPFSFLAALVAPAFMHVVWQGKWDVAAISVQILFACLPAWLITSSARALLEAQGRWRMRFAILTVYGVGGIAAAAIGAAFGGPASVAMAIAIFYCGFAIGLVVILDRRDPFAKRAARTTTVSVVASVIAIACAAAVVNLALEPRSALVRDCIAALLYMGICTAINYWMLRNIWTDIFTAVSVRITRKRQIPTV